jgi:single-strand DNA-binding protein
MSVNKVIILGRLGQDPEIKKTNTGIAVTQLNVATSDRRKDANGQWVDSTEWHRVAVFGVTAENCAKYLRKGREVYLEGKIQTRKWQDKEGKDRYTTEILANIVHFVGGKGGESSDSSNFEGNNGSDYGDSHLAGSSRGVAALKVADEVGLDDDDIPF